MKRMQARFRPLDGYREYPLEDMRRRAAEFYADTMRRRTVRSFSDRPIPRDIIEDCLRAAGTAPSGANLQPWHFVVGYPATDTVVPDIHRKSLEEIVTFM